MRIVKHFNLSRITIYHRLYENSKANSSHNNGVAPGISVSEMSLAEIKIRAVCSNEQTHPSVGIGKEANPVENIPQGVKDKQKRKRTGYLLRYAT